MEIIRAKHSGFCFGVRQAIEKTYAQLDQEHRGAIYTCGPLIHNTSVTDSLKENGVGIIHDLSETAPGDTVIIRSHGEPKSFYDQAATMDLEIVDATCPFVARIHQLVNKAFQEGRPIIIVGDRTHPEVIGINGWCNDQAFIAHSSEDARRFEESEAFLVCQTTLNEKVLQEVVSVLQEKGVDLDIQNTICNATRDRQKAADELSQKVDMMLVIGGRNSSNTRKLYEICKKNQKYTFFVENISDLPLKELQKYNRIGIAAGASTPERVIKEVISTMSENITNENNISMADIMDQIDATLRLPHAGDIVDGKVYQVTDDEVIVTMGCKKDGILMANEVSLEEGQTLKDVFHVGDEIQAKVIKTDDSDGGILLSKKRLQVNEQWNEITEAYENKTNIDVKVVKVVKGGVIAAYKEVSGFIPLSQLSNKYVETADGFIGEELTVKVTRVEQRRNRAVFSHKAVLVEERQKQIEEIWSTFQEGMTVLGTVMRFTDYGAFVDLGGIDGLLHISEISWGKLKHPDEVLHIGQEIEVMILSMNKEKGKISLGLKQTTPEPWSVINDNYSVGQVVKGKVVQLKEYGAFVELEPGLDGLVHISEVANKRVANIADELSVGQEVNAKILEIDTDRKRISLSIKEAGEIAEEEPEAEEAPAEEVPVEEATEAEEAPAEEE
ncbi:bifunctional 4-hydroxy-3-methylbut-2-enyl diphosphate reductase/30S ribosomal protein S1 [Eubacterium sp. AB3007]|uniref:bifunctional 4-hydroxy-3-methylbut-2-enyl diphosphate reductase/30S ribosomal protein S1 n=1 Tax=Eubacterium sp. AB3007 TaxID=1392487 RepID=UPI000551259A|nr:bifunctional 4-hydroxy-3-methylbut-2-enyl diphosphate reductase/30S ribosomal protein S1 [Eubacterium sp. AB3007]